MSVILANLGQRAARAVVPLLALGVGTMVLGIALQVSQNMGYINIQQWLGQGTIFGLLSKIGGTAMLIGLLFGALRLTGGDRPADLRPLDLPMSARTRPAADLVRPARVAAQKMPKISRSDGAAQL